MMMTLNHRIHRAYQRTRDASFFLEGLTGFYHARKPRVIGTGKIGVAARILKALECVYWRLILSQHPPR